jgi:predicted NBD/HSP70 family sugar kinase
MQHVGLDVHKKSIYAVVVDNDGKILNEQEFANEPRYLKRFLGTIDKEVTIALESCICWEHVYASLKLCSLKGDSSTEAHYSI